VGRRGGRHARQGLGHTSFSLCRRRKRSFERLRAWKPLFIAAAIGFAFEVLGVKTGFPFGRYVYTQTLGISLLDVPLAIACAWMVPFAFVRQVARQPLAAAVLLTATDLLIDPVASGVPLTNFAGWFLVSLLIFAWPRKPVTRNLSQRV
jgi:putative membrane protein